MSHRERDLGDHPFERISRGVSILRRLAFRGLEHIPPSSPALIATTHSSPLDLFYYLSFMRRLGRTDYSFVMAGELLDEAAFRSYTRDSLEDSLPALGAPLSSVTDRLSQVVPPLLRRLNAIPVYREGDDSESRRRSLDCLLRGELVTIAPGRGDDRHRDAAGMRPLTHGVASIARRYFDATSKPLDVVPVAICNCGCSPRSPCASDLPSSACPTAHTPICSLPLDGPTQPSNTLPTSTLPGGWPKDSPSCLSSVSLRSGTGVLSHRASQTPPGRTKAR